MDRMYGLGRLAQIAAVTMALSAPAVSTALAEELYHPGENNAFGAQQSDAPLRAARVPRATAPQDRAVSNDAYKVGQYDTATGAPAGKPTIAFAGNNGYLVAGPPVAAPVQDLAGQHGQADRIFNQIYRPGEDPSLWSH
jgi:hypothetical protein